MKQIFLLTTLSVILLVASGPIALADSVAVNTVAVGGYDAVAYHTEGKALRGSGDHVATFQGATYLFVNDRNKRRFEGNPQRYAPAFGGFCAYGVAVGKKFVGDPEIWKVVDGTLYLNLNRSVQQTWNKDIPGYIATANKNWGKIKDKAPSEL